VTESAELLKREPGPEFDTIMAIFLEKVSNIGKLRLTDVVSWSHNICMLTLLLGFRGSYFVR